MVKLAQLPSQAVIDGMAGVVDYYVYHPPGEEGKGIPCARTWPIYHESRMTEASRAKRIPFAYVNQVAKQLPLVVTDAYQVMARTTSLTWRDLLTRSYINGAKV